MYSLSSNLLNKEVNRVYNEGTNDFTLSFEKKEGYNLPSPTRVDEVVTAVFLDVEHAAKTIIKKKKNITFHKPGIYLLQYNKCGLAGRVGLMMLLQFVFDLLPEFCFIFCYPGR